MSQVSDASPVLEVRDLKVHFPVRRGMWFASQTEYVRAVDGISFDVKPGETFGLVGESGCGKSTTARAIMNLVKPTAGSVYLGGKRIDNLSPASMRQHRSDLQMIFQDPYASLNPRMTVGTIIGEPLSIFGLKSGLDRKLEVMRLMDVVGLNPRFINRYPHEFSGGQRQRIGIARALAARPKVIVCDEPISALDVSIQAQVINLLMDLQQKLGVAYVFIAHDLSVVRHISHRIGVMYLGRIVELSQSQELFRRPMHPYTQALLSAIPVPDPDIERKRQRIVLEGEVPSPDTYYPGCPFADRCPIVQPETCTASPPPLEGTPHPAACFFAGDESPEDAAKS
ncbi:Oligopeptide transport ATP-binding protein OppF [Bremerella volcania]|uniref:Oligopeptide transport ATP-binding protein OppF n=1 Tax=Bremerella volcania TaxID=2527984 RepID=A0A518CCL7_9BACT|nr:oligopeptide/dipeptide ABC transporter ATP-binding protein [Bremerella volcania]QDU76973.1 Oligopeptide transport ATP-binding protein OppF [Bremerella volcania]